MSHKERLGKMSVKVLKKEISAHNKLLKGYSKMRKSDIIDLIIKNKSLFPHLFPNKETRVIGKKTIIIRKKKKKKDVTKPLNVKAGTSNFDNLMAQHQATKKKRRLKIKRKKAPTSTKLNPMI